VKTIFRFKVPIIDKPTVYMPTGARVLPAPPGERNGTDIEIWAQVDTDAPLEQRQFIVVGTGNPLPEGCTSFIGTVVTHGGQFVWHLFEATP
jgi:hypothetical protein